ncbi:unnamed protein product [Kuraishia capsulata CBS 1993]|uniref:Aminopeptidase P N-terminal domain-containing protein n=1 Tax=Kuraishia capsulata CBS 1993 TaxID=1382522 RepID=W6MX44_9ASCO|nr:uncharacterized protein KUCA_T00004227001 [Kuraishia capsulata CBS 1993]CDK28245.1 unnamed protein product [Kuraishia capsulata CBS 1993]
MPYNYDAGPIRLTTSPEHNTSCFTSISAFFTARRPSYQNNVFVSEKSQLISDDESDCQDESKDLEMGHKLFAPYAEKRPELTTRFDSSQRLKQLREIMAANKVGVYIVPSEDEHQSEYTAAKDQRRSYISGFTGSAGVAVITLTDAVTFEGEAALSTDGRYFLQASNQLDDNWMLLKQGVSSYPTWQAWALSRTISNPFSKTLAVDPKLITDTVGKYFKTKCYDFNVEFLPIMENLVDKARGKLGDGIKFSSSKLFELELKYSGETTNSKVERVREYLKKKKSFGLVVTALDDIAWLMNLRASDIPYNPVFFAYVIIDTKNVWLYIEDSKITPAVREYLHGIDSLVVKDYKLFWDDVPAIKNTTRDPDYDSLVIPADSTYALTTNVPSTISHVVHKSLIEDYKAVKNLIEIRGHKWAQLKDGIALSRFFAWLEEKLIVKNEKVDEIEAAEMNMYYRSVLSNFKGLSFETISSAGANASIIHYSPTPSDFSVIDKKQVYLCDSGGQYLEGTTDITRTVHFTKPTAEEIKAYTLVLKGHLQLAMARFPPDTSGVTLDILARQPLWKEGMDYRHGTGHGIGSFLCVHEGPCGIGTKNSKPLQEGNVISDEPGYYKDKVFGVRIESDMLVVSRERDSDEQKFFEFEYITRVPFCRKLIDTSRLTQEQIVWLNTYNDALRKELLPYLEDCGDDRAIDWLMRETLKF